MIYRLRPKTEAEPRGPCVPRREPGNEKFFVWFPGSRLGASMIFCLVPRLPPGNEKFFRTPILNLDAALDPQLQATVQHIGQRLSDEFDHLLGMIAGT